MITVHTYSVADSRYWEIVIQGVRNSWESHLKSDSKRDTRDYALIADDGFRVGYIIGPDDMALCQRLVKAGNDHGKFLRQIPIAMDMSAPEYFWKEFDQYKIGTTTNSTSMMHVLGKHLFSRDLLDLEDMEEEDVMMLLSYLNKLRDKWINTGKKKPGKEWRAMLKATPNSWIYRRAVTANYQVLANMYHSRKHHRLQEWHDFCAWIETLPYSQLITYDNC